MRWRLAVRLVLPLRWFPGACLLAWCICHGIAWAAAAVQVSDAWQAWLDQDGVVQGAGLTVMQQELLQRSQDELLHQLQAPPLFTALALHGARLLALRPDGSVYGFGENALGQLGQSVPEHRRRPVAPQERFFSSRLVERMRLVYGILGARQLALGGGHSLALLEDGALCAWGYGDLDQLGTKPPRSFSPKLVSRHILENQLDTKSTKPKKPFAVQLVPRKVAGLPPLTAVTAGDDHSLALDAQGQVWSWGLNNMGQLGDGTRDNRYRPRAIAGLGVMTAVVAGAGHSLALDSQGQVWSWGENTRGQLGRFTGRHMFARKPMRVAGLPVVAAVAAAGDVSAALGRDGTVWWWGGRLERNVALRPVPWELRQLQGVGRAVSVVAFDKGLVVTDQQHKVWLFTEPYESPPHVVR